MSNKTLLFLENMQRQIDLEAGRSIDQQNQIPRCPCCRDQLRIKQDRCGPRWLCNCYEGKESTVIEL